MKNIKIVSLFAALFFAPALLLCAQTAAPKTAKPVVKKPAAKPAAAPAAVASSTAAPAAQPKAGQAAAPAADPFAEALEKLKSADPAARREGADLIGQTRNAKGAPALLSALSDDSARVRQAAADALGMLTWRAASPKLSEMLLKDGDANVRQQAISLSHHDPASRPPGNQRRSPAVRYSALHTLAVMKYAPARTIMVCSSADANTAAARSPRQQSSEKAAPAAEEKIPTSTSSSRR